jgi:ankyrin repeat protein
MAGSKTSSLQFSDVSTDGICSVAVRECDEESEEGGDALESMDDIEDDIEVPTEMDPAAQELFQMIEDSHISEAIEFLSSGSVSPDCRGVDGDTPLHLACLYGHEELAAFLLERNVDVDAVDEDNSVPLHNASAGGYVSIVQMLLGKKAQIQVCDSDGETPLHLAANGDHAGVVRILLAAGADPKVQNNDGETPLDLGRAEDVIACFQ